MRRAIVAALVVCWIAPAIAVILDEGWLIERLHIQLDIQPDGTFVSGHATRSMVMLKHLVAQHDVQIVVSGRAHAFLRKSFPLLEVHEIAGLNMIYEDNATL